jgi:long-chain acyl-CoA synthetase
MTPIDALYRQAKDHPNSVAFVSNDAWSYRRLAAEVEGMARALLARSLRQGIAYYACLRIGAIATPMDLRFKTAELRHVFQRLQPALYIGEVQLYSQIEPEVFALDARFITGSTTGYDGVRPWARLFDNLIGGPIPQQPDAQEPAVLLTPSGTTGQPKFVTHAAETLSAITNTWPHPNLNSQQIAIKVAAMVHAVGFIMFPEGIKNAAWMILFKASALATSLLIVWIGLCAA